MFKWLKQRTDEPEMMDDYSMGGLELRKAFRHLRRLNRILGAAAPTLYGVQQLWTQSDKPRHFTILDIGSGSGDVNRRLLRWADANQIDVSIVLADITEEACEEARQYYHNEPRVQVMRMDLFALPEACADVITGTQFIHHFTANELPLVIERMLKCSRIGVVINDIHRHWIPWSAVWLTTRLVSNSRYIHNDGPLSVAKGFRSADWEYIGKTLGILDKFYYWRPLFRYVAVIRKNRLS